SFSGRSQAILTRWRATEGGKAGLAPASRLVGEARKPLAEVALDPLAGVADGEAGGRGSIFESVAVVQEQEQAGASGQALFEVGGAEPAFEFLAMDGGQLDGEGGFAAAHGSRFQQGIQTLGGKGLEGLS